MKKSILNKQAEEDLFRANVQQYLKTGKSNVLTDKEKAKLDAVRPKLQQEINSVLGYQRPGILASIKNYFRS